MYFASEEHKQNYEYLLELYKNSQDDVFSSVVFEHVVDACIETIHIRTRKYL